MLNFFTRMNCPNCGKKIEENDPVCPHCGLDLERTLGNTELRSLAEPLLEKARKAVDGGSNLRAALQAIEQALEYVPESAEAHNLRGLLLDNLELPREAIQEYREAVRLQPEYQEAKENLANAEEEIRKPSHRKPSAPPSSGRAHHPSVIQEDRNDDTGLRDQITSSMQLKTDEELTQILEENDHEEWTGTAFEVARQILIQRTGRLPEPPSPLEGKPAEWDAVDWQSVSYRCGGQAAGDLSGIPINVFRTARAKELIVARARVSLKDTLSFGHGGLYNVKFAIQFACTLFPDGSLEDNFDWQGHHIFIVNNLLYDRINEHDRVDIVFVNEAVLGLLADFL
jgi:tetratricopeptide (TPR) repeat protein